MTAVVTSAPVGVPAAWLAQLPALKVVSSFGVGLDRLPLDAARAAHNAGHPHAARPDLIEQLAHHLNADRQP